MLSPCRYRIQWFAPEYAPQVEIVQLRFFTSDQGFDSREASAVADLEPGDELNLDCIRVERVEATTKGRWS